MKPRYVVAVTGASGAVYAVRLLEVLLAAGCDVHLTISQAAQTVMHEELELNVDLDNFNPASLLLDNGQVQKDDKLQMVRSFAGISSESSNVLSIASGEQGQLLYHHFRDFTASIASGSFLTQGMIVCPCSCGTLSSIVHGASENLIHRAAEVHLKEGRKLILVTRESPLSKVILKNMLEAAEAGATVVPASPGFYHGPTTIQDLVDFVVGRICDQLGIANVMIRRWGM